MTALLLTQQPLARRSSRLIAELIIATFVVLMVGCIYGGMNEGTRFSSTRVTSAQLGSRTPLLPLFVLRIAESELALSSEQATTVSRQVRLADQAARPVDDARIVYLETLAASLDAGQFREERVTAAADRLRRATEEIAPTFGSLMEDLHRTLSVNQRSVLVQIVMSSSRFDRWVSLWSANTEPAEQRARANRWLKELAEDDGRSLFQLMSEDLTTTVNVWITNLRVRAQQAITKGDFDARREMAIQLRTNDARN